MHFINQSWYVASIYILFSHEDVPVTEGPKSLPVVYLG